MIFLLDRVVDIVFTIDIFINFRTAWKDAAGEDVFESRIAAKRYLKGWFALDIVSIFPFDFIVVEGEAEGAWVWAACQSSSDCCGSQRYSKYCECHEFFVDGRQRCTCAMACCV